MPTFSAIQVAFLMVGCQQAVLALGWAVGAAVLRLDRRSTAQWAGYALCTCASLLLFVWASHVGVEGWRALGNVSIAAGLMLMQRGVRQFTGREAPAWIYLVALAFVGWISWWGITPAHGPVRVATVSALLAVLCAATAFDIVRYTRQVLALRWGWLLGVPLLLGVVVFGARALRAALWPEVLVAELTGNLSLNIGSALVFLVTALVFHLTLVALVAARLTAELRRLSRVDSLTELFNRRAMDEMLADEARRSLRSNRPFSVLMVDADYFKAINDRFGHSAGDEALRHLAQILRAQMRDVDRVGRFGGEEFIVLMPGTAATEALSAAERLRDALVRRPWSVQGEPFTLTLSVGVAAWRGPKDRIDALLERADAALYRAKALGRDRFEFGQ